MSLVIPDSEVILCGNVPFDTNYNATKLYASKEAQFSDISSKALYTAGSCRYVRGSKAIRLNVPASIAYKVNYIIYRNTSFENKYFYAFIVAVNYVNNDLFEFVFELDVIQTWMFDYVLSNCYVVREHIANDSLYASRTAETLETGDSYVTGQFQETYTRELMIVVETSFIRIQNEDGTFKYETASGGMVGKTYDALTHYAFKVNNDTTEGLPALQLFINQTVKDGKNDGIVTIKMLPSKVGYENLQVTLYDHDQSTPSDDNSFKEGTPFEGYVPKNKKLYNYPYRFIKVLNGRGSAGIYKWEESNVSTKRSLPFRISITDFSGETVLSALYNMSSGSARNVCDIMTYNAVNACAYSTDAYKAWLAQNQGQIQFLNTARNLNMAKATVQIIGSAANSSIKAVGNLASGDTIGAAATGLQGVTNAAVGAQIALYDDEIAVARINGIMQDHEVLPPSACVPSTSGSGAFNSGFGGYTFQTCSIRGEYAKIIDDYFTMYGYACHQVKTPNLHTRQSFNYIKTIGAVARGYAPANDLRIIQDIFNKGITFWHTALDSIGNYGLNNGSV